MMRDGLIFHLLDFFELLDVIQAAFQRGIKILSGELRKVLFIYFGNSLLSEHITGLFNKTQMLIDQIEQRIDPRWNGYGASAHGKIDIGGTALRRNQLLAAAFIPCVGAKWMVAFADHTLKVFFLCCAAHTAPSITLGAPNVHIRQR